MGDTTGISWTEATWNPWMGCTKVWGWWGHMNDPREIGLRAEPENGSDARRYCYPQCRDPWFNECADCWRDGGNPPLWRLRGAEEPEAKQAQESGGGVS